MNFLWRSFFIVQPTLNAQPHQEYPKKFQTESYDWLKVIASKIFSSIEVKIVPTQEVNHKRKYTRQTQTQKDVNKTEVFYSNFGKFGKSLAMNFSLLVN